MRVLVAAADPENGGGDCCCCSAQNAEKTRQRSSEGTGVDSVRRSTMRAVLLLLLTPDTFLEFNQRQFRNAGIGGKGVRQEVRCCSCRNRSSSRSDGAVAQVQRAGRPRRLHQRRQGGFRNAHPVQAQRAEGFVPRQRSHHHRLKAEE